MVKASAKFTVETFSAGNGEVDVKVENPKGLFEPVWNNKLIFRSLKMDQFIQEFINIISLILICVQPRIINIKIV